MQECDSSSHAVPNYPLQTKQEQTRVRKFYKAQLALGVVWDGLPASVTNP
ncbi:unnamed protein product [Chondrus crispus]|uniref:Uncharacterized protein n=1 Tax=Chondrus crispus TaxID=2769 RepID=R7QJH3_CHOCR|nr:unnamed protein product [Chondrus crispus]CDF38249.1 unnamed protein product [Chondrus crispus]|eukprot:XP_005718134.1 unnamed protein product [Chondrus crispus]